MTVATAVLALAVLAAALLAAADGALLATADAAAPAAAAPLVRERERVHRVLSAARVVAFVVAGGAAVVVFAVRERPSLPAALTVVGIALIAAALAEGAAWAVGDARGGVLLGRVAPVVRAAQVVLAPLGALVGRLDAALTRTLPAVGQAEEAREAAAAQFRQVVAVEADATRRERGFLNGVFSLRDTEVRDVMVPRVDMIAIDRDTPWSELTARVRSREHARYPIYRETLDDIVGILYTKDLLPWVVADEPPTLGWHALVRPGSFIPTTKTIDAQLRDFKASGSHIAIVVDEYGGTAGLVTIEDILEQIVGEIRDEHDEEEDEVEQEDGKRYWVSGRLPLDDLSELLEHDFRREGIATVAGLIYDVLGRVPRAGEELTLGGFRIVVEKVTGRRVRRVYFERTPAMAGREAE